MDCYKLNEGVYKKIENVLDIPKTEINQSEPTYYKSIYGPEFLTANAKVYIKNGHSITYTTGTLMNDWFEKRTGTEYQQTQPEPYITENMDQYREFCAGIFPNRADYFSKIFDSYGLGQELLLDHLGFTYYNNYTTTYDLMFQHLPKKTCGPFPRHYAKGHYLPETDLTKVYGNLTQWGLKERVYNSMTSHTCKEEKDVSETYARYRPYNLQAVRKLNDFQNYKRVKVMY